MNTDMPSNASKLRFILIRVKKKVLSAVPGVTSFRGSVVSGTCIESTLQHCCLGSHVLSELRLAVSCSMRPRQPKTVRDVVTEHIDDAIWGPSCCSTGSGNDTTKITTHLFVQNTQSKSNRPCTGYSARIWVPVAVVLKI